MMKKAKFGLLGLVAAAGESVADGVRTVTVGKKGKDYPALLAIALVRREK